MISDNFKKAILLYVYYIGYIETWPSLYSILFWFFASQPFAIQILSKSLLGYNLLLGIFWFLCNPFWHNMETNLSGKKQLQFEQFELMTQQSLKFANHIHFPEMVKNNFKNGNVPRNNLCILQNDYYSQ